MRISIFVLEIFVAAVAVGQRAEAQNYPWCAQYRDGGATNCGFVSFEQCMDTIRGAGGFCNQNTQYQPPPGPHPSGRARSHY
jgi:uncharacterized protein DUF3551